MGGFAVALLPQALCRFISIKLRSQYRAKRSMQMVVKIAIADF
jgi:hypothetical protein